MALLGYLLLVSLTFTAIVFLIAALGTLRIGRLTDRRDRANGAPRVTVVLAARNEAAHLDITLQALVAQSYQPLDVVVVDDRSTDATGAIADRASRANPRLKAIHVETLPAGWLGKNHALHVGAKTAGGELLLFTDADVRLHPDAVANAVAAMTGDRLDHLAVMPTITSPSRAVRWYIGAFAIFFLIYTRVWDVADPRRKSFIGIGAFNMVRTSAYRDAGGHSRIRLRPDDDLMLGKVLKGRGGRAGVLLSDGTVNVDWYATFGELVRGVEKNTFAGLNYRLWAAALSVLALIAHSAYFLLPLALTGPSRWLALVDLLVVLAGAAVAAPTVGQPAWCTLLQPVAVLLFAWVQGRATVLTLVRGGISWRDTFYPLSELRRAVVDPTGPQD